MTVLWWRADRKGKFRAQRNRGHQILNLRVYGVLLPVYVVLMAFVGMLLTVFIRGGSWSAIELIKVHDEPTWSGGYVVDVDDVSLSFLYLDGGLRRIPNGDVEQRIVCPSYSDMIRLKSGISPSIAEGMLRRNNDVPDPICQAGAIRWS
jgi:hypothetical protein